MHMLLILRPDANALPEIAFERIQKTGFDPLFHQSLRPHVLEVNLSPSMQADTPLDYKIKPSVVRDVLDLTSPHVIQMPEKWVKYAGNPEQGS
jgi:hypothetical protein